MNDDYLWDKSGKPDPEVEHLEKLLSRYRAPVELRRRRSWKPALLVAAALVMVVVGSLLAVRFHWRTGASWVVEGVDGPSRLHVGETLRTKTPVRVQVARIGELEVGPGSEITLIETSSDRHRIALRRGSIAARVWAPPFTFSVDTPAGLASDVGCAFTIRYDEGNGLLHVTSGWVDFDGDDRSSLVPAGAVSELRDERGPGTPYYLDAPPDLRQALRDYDATRNRASLDRVIAAARAGDAMTLIHLLERASGEEGAPLFDRLAALAPPPPGVTREGVLARDLRMLDAWRRSLGLGSAKRWWVHWRDSMPQR